jgi:PAS domain S-box-containing protein
MTMITNLDGNDTLEALVHCRRTVLKRAMTLMEEPADIPFAERIDAIPSLSALLTTSLEELKVAEEELRNQNEKLIAQRMATEEQTRYYRQLFLHSPAPAFVTDFYGTIQESNLAAARLFRREASHLERKPLAALLAPERREAFRRQLTLISKTVDGVRDWQLVMQRVGDLPVTVHAAVEVVPEVGATRSGLLYWMLHAPAGNG